MSDERRPGWLATPDDARGMRRLLARLGGDPAREAAEALLALPAEARLVLCTGFPVSGRPETDGPPGTIALARALLALGRRVAFASWDEVLEALAARVPEADLIDVSSGASFADPAVAIEVCGRGPDGAYRTMRGEDISASAPHFEDVLAGELVVAVGDGGNELGMSEGSARVVVPARVPVPASVSNWGALAIVAELSRLMGRDLLPTRAEHEAVLEALHARGFVDGFTGLASRRVDGRPFSDELALLDALRQETTPG